MKTETPRPSAAIALELEDLQTRRGELQSDLDSARETYDASRKNVVLRVVKMGDAIAAKSALDAVESICAEVDEQIAALQTELRSAQASEARAAQVLELTRLKSDFDAQFEQLQTLSLDGATALQTLCKALYDGSESNFRQAGEIRNRLARLEPTLDEQFKIGVSFNPTSPISPILNWTPGHMMSKLESAAEPVSISVAKGLYEMLPQFFWLESRKPDENQN